MLLPVCSFSGHCCHRMTLLKTATFSALKGSKGSAVIIQSAASHQHPAKSSPKVALHRNPVIGYVAKRCHGSAGESTGMSAWQARSYGRSDQLKLVGGLPVPVIKSPQDVLVKVHATSINPLDVRMLGGYGYQVLKAARTVQSQLQNAKEFPLVLGRDFSGVAVSVGKGVRPSNIKPGDEVWGVIEPLNRCGAHAEYVLAKSNTVTKKPPTLSHTEAAALPYVAMTAWSTVSTVGGLSKHNAKDKRILLLGASGGMGTFLIQLLKYWGCIVTAVCPTDGVAMVTSLGADIVLDYQTTDVKRDIPNIGRYDMIVDLVGKDRYKWTMSHLEKGSNYITPVTPLLHDTDQYGLPFGIAKSLMTLAENAIPNLLEGKSYRWSMFIPNKQPLKVINSMAEHAMIKPVICQVYPFSQLPEAYDHVTSGSAIGKVVVEVIPEDKPH